MILQQSRLSRSSLEQQRVKRPPVSIALHEIIPIIHSMIIRSQIHRS